MRLPATLLALAVLATGCADPDAPVVTISDTVVVPDGNTSPDGADEVDAPMDDGPNVVSAVDAGEDAGAVEPAPMSAADAGEESTPLAAAKSQGTRSTDRPATKTTSVNVEGKDYTETLRLADFPDFPVPFSTYLREGITVEQPGSGDAISFEMGGAQILVNVARSSTAAATLARVREAAPPVPKNTIDAAWAHGAFAYTAAHQGGALAVETYVAEHDGTVYTVEASYPVEMGDGIAPTIEVLFDEWQWADGAAL